MTHYNTIYRHDKRIVIDNNGLDYLLHLENKIYEFEHPEEQLLKAEGLLLEYYDLICERDTYKKRIEKAINYINGVYEMAVYTKSKVLDEENIEDLLDIIGGDINDR